jgi:ATP-dependent helicase/DNAse subunit B
MRLISSAKHVHLIYQQSKDKERSRFIEELIWEEQKKQKTVDEIPVLKPSFQVNIKPLVKRVKKTPAMIEFLKQHTYSASSINMYMNNPMEFYTNYVLGLREQEDLLDEPEARHVGTFIHQLLEVAFKPYLGKAPKIDTLFANQLTALCDERFASTFAKQMKSDSFLLKAVIDERLEQFIENERTSPDRQVAKILYLEHRFPNTIALPVGDISFLYVIDRIDQMKTGEIMIIDYKTGMADLIPKKLGEIATMTPNRETIQELVKSFQIPLYFHYLHEQYPDQEVNAALYSLKTMKLHKFIDERTTFDRAEIDKIFCLALNGIMAEILDPDVDFIEDKSDTHW